MDGQGLTMRLVDALYAEAMLLADEARSYFDDHGRVERDALPPLSRVAFTCESLKVTTRLMHVIAWLLTRRAVEAGDLSMADARDPSRRLGRMEPAGGPVGCGGATSLPAAARDLIVASDDLYQRVRRLDDGLEQPTRTTSPAHGLLRRLERAF